MIIKLLNHQFNLKYCFVMVIVLAYQINLNLVKKIAYFMVNHWFKLNHQNQKD